jgi:steroid 5-alpha reductase family enzyme
MGDMIPLFFAEIALALTMTGAFLAQRMTGRSGWIDTIWSFAVGIVGSVIALVPISPVSTPGGRQIMTAALAIAWSLRLGAHIMVRTLKGGEDPRYQALKDQWGADFSRRLFWFLQIQAAAAFLLVLSIDVAAKNPSPFPGLGDAIGAIILIVAIGGEAIADAQLARFKANPANRDGVCDIGLWSMSRHPNYFFEWLGWCAYPFIAIGVPPANLYGTIALIGPLFMYWLLAHVSGVPPLEEHMARSRGAGFAAYRARVNAFFPGPSRPSIARPDVSS